MTNRIWVLAVLPWLYSCGANVPLEKNVSLSRAAAAERIVAYSKGELEDVPEIERTIGPVEGHSCKNKFWDKVGEEAALQQAKLKALDAGANGIVEVEYNWSGTELARNCWKSVTASGVAVKFSN